jgi:hypothetical protein
MCRPTARRASLARDQRQSLSLPSLRARTENTIGLRHAPHESQLQRSGDWLIAQLRRQEKSKPPTNNGREMSTTAVNMHTALKKAVVHDVSTATRSPE